MRLDITLWYCDRCPEYVQGSVYPDSWEPPVWSDVEQRVLNLCEKCHERQRLAEAS
jgi:hypothetical protein